MASPGIYEMEAKYLAMSRQLDSKTAELLKRAENVVKNQENCIFSLITPSGSVEDVSDINKYHPDSLSESTLHYYKEDADSYIEKKARKSISSKKSMSSEEKETIRSNKKAEHVQALLETRNRIRNESFKEGVSQRSDSLPNLNEIHDIKDCLDCSEFEDKTDDEDDLKTMMKEVEDHKQLDKTINNLIEARDYIKKNGKGSGDKSYNRSSACMPFSLSKLNAEQTAPQLRKAKAERFPKFENEFNEGNRDFDTRTYKGSRNLSEETIITTLKTNYKLIKDELRKTQEVVQKRNTDLETAAKCNQTLEDSKQKIMLQLNNVRMQASKLDGKVTNLTSKLQGKDIENRTLRSERDALSKAAKEAAQEGSGTELRLARAREEIGSLKEALSTARSQGKEYQSITQQQQEENQLELKHAQKKSRMALVTIKKQAVLIDNLKRQVDLLSASHEVNKSAEQLNTILGWKHKKIRQKDSENNFEEAES